MIRLKNNVLFKFFSIIIICATLFFSCQLLTHQPILIDDTGKPSPELLELLATTHVEHDGTLESIKNATQKEWLNKIRPGTTERWEINQETKEAFEEFREQVIPLCKKIGTFDTLNPEKKKYKYLVILGCRALGMSKRLQYAIELTKSGIKFKKLVFLTGQRPLMHEETPEKVEKVFTTILQQNGRALNDEDFPKHEAAMIKYLFDHTQIPQSWISKDKLFIESPMWQKEEGGEWLRPTTQHTIEDWMQTNPKPGSILAISDQPHCLYQHEVIKTYMPEIFSVETVGNGAAENTSVALILDALARAIYQKHQQLLKK